MLPHEERVVTEKQELDAKLEKLRAFTRGPVFRMLSPTDRNLLMYQAIAMTTYSQILDRRIEIFKERT